MSVALTHFKRLSPQEWRLLRLIAEGINPKGISKMLSISVKTVSQHTTNIEKKLELENRVFLQKMLVTIMQQTDPQRSTTSNISCMSE
jgi:DNA-binding NarL/FixJ family response regulator